MPEEKIKLTRKVRYSKAVEAAMSEEEKSIVNMLADKEPSCYADIAVIMIEYSKQYATQVAEAVKDECINKISGYIESAETTDDELFQQGIKRALTEVIKINISNFIK